MYTLPSAISGGANLVAAPTRSSGSASLSQIGCSEPVPAVETSYARRMFEVGAMLAAGSLGRLPDASFDHRMAFDVPFADSERMPPGMPPGDAVPKDAVAVPRATGSALKWPPVFEKA